MNLFWGMQAMVIYGVVGVVILTGIGLRKSSMDSPLKAKIAGMVLFVSSDVILAALLSQGDWWRGLGIFVAFLVPFVGSGVMIMCVMSMLALMAWMCEN